MYSRRILECDLLPGRDYGSHVLASFDVGTAKDIVSSTVRFLNDENTSTRVLATEAHLQWAMECIGHAFVLPMSESDIIYQAKELYGRWLYEDQPTPFHKRKGHYFEAIVCHLSLIFQDRRYSSTAHFERHKSICKSVLTLFTSIGVELSSVITASNWEVLLKVILGVADEVIRSSSNLSATLTPFVLQVLFDLWIRSKTQSIHLWSLLGRFSQHWADEIKYYSLLNLVKRAFTVQLAQSKTTADVHIDWSLEPATTVVPFSRDLLLFYWYQLHAITGSPTAIRIPMNMKEAIQGVADTIEYLWGVDEHAAGFVATNGAAVLRIFGPWIFQVAELEDPSFVQSRSTAMALLTRLFCVCDALDFSQPQIARLYCVLQTTLTAEATASPTIASLLQHGHSLFATRLAGVRLLIPSVLPHIRRILEQNAPPALRCLRHPALRLLSSLIGVNNNYHTVGSTRTGPVSLSKIKHQLLSIPTLLLNAVCYDDDEANIQLALHLLHVQILEDRLIAFRFFEVINAAVWPLLHEYRWPHVIATSALRLIAGVSFLYRRVDDLQRAALRSVVANYANFALTTLDRMHDKDPKPGLPGLLDTAYNCLEEVLGYAPALLRDSRLAQLVVKSVLNGLSQDLPVRVRNAAARLHRFLFERMGRSRSLGAMNTVVDHFSIPLEHTILRLLHDAAFLDNPATLLAEATVHDQHATKHFRCRSAALTLVQLPDATSGAVLLLLRDVSGKTCWMASPAGQQPMLQPQRRSWAPQHVPKFAGQEGAGSPAPVLDLVGEALGVHVATRGRLVEAGAPVSGSAALYAPGLARWWEKARFEPTQTNLVQHVLTVQQDAERRASRPTDAFPACIQPFASPLPPKAAQHRFREARTLLANLGLISPASASQQRDLQLLRPGKRLKTRLQQVEETAPHQVLTVALLFATEGQRSIDDMVANTRPSPAFQQLVHSLGEMMSLQTYRGFMGGLSLDDADAVAYHAEPGTELFFHVPSSMTCAVDRKRFVSCTNLVRVVWSQDAHVIPLEREFCKAGVMTRHLHDTAASSFPLVYIFLFPMDETFFRVAIDQADLEAVHDAASPALGPLTHNCVVRSPLLPVLLRETCINYTRHILAIVDPFGAPDLQRETAVQAVFARAASDMSAAEYYASLFITGVS